MACLAIAISMVALLTPLALPPEDSAEVMPDATRVEPSQALPSSPRPGPSRAQLEQLAALDLRQPLQPAAKTVTAATSAQLNLQLVGTVMEGDQSAALLQGQDGVVQICVVGQSVEIAGATVVVTQVDWGSVRLLHAGTPVELSLPVAPEQGEP